MVVAAINEKIDAGVNLDKLWEDRKYYEVYCGTDPARGACRLN